MAIYLYKNIEMEKHYNFLKGLKFFLQFYTYNRLLKFNTAAAACFYLHMGEQGVFTGETALAVFSIASQPRSARL